MPESVSISDVHEADRSEAFDAMLRERDIDRLFNEGVLSFERLGSDAMPRAKIQESVSRKSPAT